MGEEQHWTPAMHSAWQFAARAVNEGISGAAGQRAFRAGGGAIRDKDWDQLMRWAKEMPVREKEAGEFWRAIDLPESVYQPSPWEFRETYKMTAEVRYRDLVDGKYKRHWYSVADTQTKSREAWMSALNIAMERYGEFVDLSTVTVTRTVFWHGA